MNEKSIDNKTDYYLTFLCGKENFTYLIPFPKKCKLNAVDRSNPIQKLNSVTV